MAATKLLSSLILLHLLFTCLLPPPTALAQQNSDLFREYIGAEFNSVKLSDVPINPGVEFHLILGFAVNYSADGTSPTNGQFNVFWDTGNLAGPQIAALKQAHSNVRVALSLGGDTTGGSSWVANAVSSLTPIIQQYNLNGIDIDYEHFIADADTFAECVGRLVKALKSNGVISFASIAPFDDDSVQGHYMALWNKYGDVIDYVNFQFYAYESGTTVDQFLSYFEKQCSNYGGGRVLVSFSTGGGGGLKPDNGFFDACRSLKMLGKLHGIFVWSADDSLKDGFQHEMTSQNLSRGYDRLARNC